MKKLISVFTLFFLILSHHHYTAIKPGNGKNPKGGKILVEEIDSFLSDIYPADEPGATVIVNKKGETVFRKGYGVANLELGIPLKPEMVFRLGSITKQFTATAIMILVEENKISLQDKITQFLPDYPSQNQKITIEHLLTHTSGIKSYTSLAEWFPLMRRELSVAELINLFKDEPLEFKPGEHWKYSNSGYILLGAIIKKVSGMSYEKFIQKRIFKPLGMKNSYYGSHKKIIPGRVSGYLKVKKGFANADFISMTHPYAAGSLLSTVDDLAKWNNSLRNNTLITKKSHQKMVTPYKLNTGKTTSYGYGWGLFNFKGHPVISHSGGINGFSTYSLYLPRDEIFVAVLSNCRNGDAGPSYIANWISGLMIGKPFKHQKAIQLNPKILDKYVGLYKISKDVFRTITRNGNQLLTQRTGGFKFKAYPESETEFFYKYTFAHFTFIKDKKGKVTGMIMFAPAGIEEAVKIEKKGIDVHSDILDKLVGTYKFPIFTVIVFKKGNRLFTKIDDGKPDEILAQSETLFLSKQSDAQFIFQKSKNGEPIGLILELENQKMQGRKIN